MPDNPKVTVKLDDDGKVVGLDIDGDIDRNNLTEERPSKPPPLPDTGSSGDPNLRGIG